MNDESEHNVDNKPIQRKTSRMRFSPVWLVPLVAVLVGLSMAVSSWMSRGPTITITFEAAAGIEAGKTPVKYKDVTVGMVRGVSLSEDGDHVDVSVALENNAKNLAHADTRFWVVRPRIGSGGVSGIDTLLSGVYIGADMGKSTEEQKHFSGLERPPTVINGTLGASFHLRSDDLGSLDIGSPIYYRHIQVGRISAFQLEREGGGVDIEAFVNSPYDKLVTPGTRFWNASGVEVSLGAGGLRVNTQSLSTIVAGGIAFDLYEKASKDAPMPKIFDLEKDRETALSPPKGPADYMQLHFERSFKGLEAGSTVFFAGIEIGNVASLDLDYDEKTKQFPLIAKVRYYPKLISSVLKKLPSQSTSSREIAYLMKGLVDRGLRAQVKPANLLTGQLYISIDFVPNTPAVGYDPSVQPFSIPTVSDDFGKIQNQISNIVNKLEKIPFDKIGNNVNKSLEQLNSTLKNVNEQIIPSTKAALEQTQKVLSSAQSIVSEDSPLQQTVSDTLNELQKTAKSVRILSDYLGRNPDSLLRGVPKDKQEEDK